MSATSAPYGFQPVYHPTGIIRAKALKDGILSTYATNIFQGTPVLIATATGTLQAVTANNVDFIGVFKGVQYTPTANQRPVYQDNWIAGTSYVAGSLIAYYYEADPELIFSVQADGSVAQAAIGDQANITNFTAGNTTTGLSEATLGSSLVGAGVQGQWRIRDIDPSVGNEWGDAYTKVYVSIARSQYYANKTAI
jgi:hypothetical protein